MYPAFSDNFWSNLEITFNLRDVSTRAVPQRDVVNALNLTSGRAEARMSTGVPHSFCWWISHVSQGTLHGVMVSPIAQQVCAYCTSLISSEKLAPQAMLAIPCSAVPVNHLQDWSSLDKWVTHMF